VFVRRTEATMTERASPAPPLDVSIALQLADFAARTTFDDLPADVVERAKLLVLDAVGTAFASGSFDFASRALGALTSFGPGTNPVIGLDARLDLRDAALMNGILVHGLDFDDTHLSGVVHVSASALPAALAIASDRRLSGRDLLLGHVLGVEVTARVGAAANGGFHRAGFHPTGVAGAFGCAVAAGRLDNLSPAQLRDAQGFALSLASGPMQFVEEGAWTKRVHSGWAAMSGITAAAFARIGFTSPQFAYEGSSGLYRTHLRDDEPDLNALTKGLGDDWQLDEVAVKLFPTCHLTHTSIEAATDLVRMHRLSADEIAHVVCLVHDDYLPIVCEPRERKIAPSSDYEAKFSLQYVVASALVNGRFTLNELSDDALRDPQVLDLARRVDYRNDPDSGYPRFYSGEVIVHTTDGRVLSQRELINRGAPERPIASDDVIDKFRANLEFAGVDGARIERLIDAVLTVDACPDVREFAELLAGR
jgi:2-methylcitrate dehydratase PrpD